MSDFYVNSNDNEIDEYEKNVFLIRSKELDHKEIYIVLKNFDPTVHRHSDTLINCERFFSFLYYTPKSTESPKEPSRKTIERERDAEVVKFTDIISNTINHTHSEKKICESLI